MTTYTLERGQIKDIISYLSDTFTAKWENDNTISFKSEKKEVGKLSLDNLDITLTGELLEKKLKKLVDIIKDATKKKVTDAKMMEVFSNFNEKKNKFGEIENYPTVVTQLKERLSKLNIKKVLVETDLGQLQLSIFDDLTLVLEGLGTESPPNNYYSILRKHLFATLGTKFDKFENVPLYGCNFLREMTKEKIVPITLGEVKVGIFYPERNLILTHFNPLQMTRFSLFEEELPETLEIFLDMLGDLKATKTNISSIKEKVFLEEFLKNSKERKQALIRDMKTYTNDVTSHEQAIGRIMEDYISKRDELRLIDLNLEESGKGIFEEIEKAKKLPFVENITLGTATIDIKYIPAIIPISRLATSSSEKDIKRNAYVGSITFQISPGKFKVIGDAPFVTTYNKNPHPHASDTGSPCFGGGNGREKIYECLASNKIRDLAKILWFWIQTYNDDTAYIHTYAYYQDRLTHGYPVFDAKGKRIDLGDADDIKLGAQQKDWTKATDYNKNIKKFKDVKMKTTKEV